MSHNHNHAGPCCHCGITRRRFLTQVGAAAGAAALANMAADGACAYDLRQHVDAAGLRPRPKVRVRVAVLRFAPPYWLGWPGTAYPVEKFSAEYPREIKEAGDRLGVTVEAEEVPIENEDALAKFIQRNEAEKVDASVAVLQHMGTWPWAQRIADSSVPAIIFSPVGTSFTGHVLAISQQKGVHVISSMEMAAVEQALRMVRCKRQLEETRLLVVAGDARQETVLPNLGVKLRYVPRRIFKETFDQMPEGDEVHEVAERIKDLADEIIEPRKQDRLTSARAYVTAKSVIAGEEAHAISMDCLGMVGSRIVPTPPCMCWTMLQDTGVTAGCEADVFGAISLMFTSYLLDRPGYMNDPVAETYKNRLIASHCTCGTRLNGFDKPPVPLILRSHSESDIGISSEVIWPEGEPCSLISFQGDKQLILDTGIVEENVKTPPAGGCRTSIEITMDDVEDARDVLGFHQVVSLGNHRRAVEAYAQMYGLDIIHSPERHKPIGAEA
jgi:hypothetical protein